MLISINSPVLNPWKRKAEFWTDVADVSPSPSDLRKGEGHLSDGAVQIRAGDNGRRWHRAGIEYDGSLASGSLVTQTVWPLIFWSYWKDSFQM